jgi:hypothetical protein
VTYNENDSVDRRSGKTGKDGKTQDERIRDDQCMGRITYVRTKKARYRSASYDHGKILFESNPWSTKAGTTRGYSPRKPITTCRLK